MTTDELQNYINKNNELEVNKIKEILFELKKDCFKEISKTKNFNDWRVQWYQGQANGLQIALYLLEKVKEVK